MALPGLKRKVVERAFPPVLWSLFGLASWRMVMRVMSMKGIGSRPKTEL